MDQKSGKQIKSASRTTTKTSKPAKTTATKTVKTAKTTKTVQPATSTTKTTSAKKSTPKSTSKTASTEHKVRKHKKPAKKIWTVLGTLLVLILLAVAGLAIWYFAYYNQPDKIAFDAVQKVINSDNIALDGAIIVEPKDQTYFKTATLFLNSSSDGLPNSTKADLLVTLDDQKEDGFVKISLGTVAMVDGVLYARFDGLEESLRNLGLDESFGGVIKDAIAEVDGEWWRISTSDIKESFELNQAVADAYTNVYSCAIEMINQDKRGELTQLYTDHQFVSVERTDDGGSLGSTPGVGYNYYRATLDMDKLADFINTLPETESANSFYSCYNNVMENYTAELGAGADETISAADFDEIDGDDIRQNFPEDLTIIMEISDFTHELRQIAASANDGQITASFGLLYQAAQVSAPEEYRPLSELVSRVKNILYGAMTGGL